MPTSTSGCRQCGSTLSLLAITNRRSATHRLTMMSQTQVLLVFVSLCVRQIVSLGLVLSEAELALEEAYVVAREVGILAQIHGL
jgi:hypothetical protein